MPWRAAANSPTAEKFCSNAFITCGYPDPLTGNVGVPAGTALTTVTSSCHCIPSGASWSNGTLEITGNNVTAYAVFKATHTGEGGPPRTGKSTSSDYVYSMNFEGDKIRHMTKIWNSGWALKELGW